MMPREQNSLLFLLFLAMICSAEARLLSRAGFVRSCLVISPQWQSTSITIPQYFHHGQIGFLTRELPRRELVIRPPATALHALPLGGKESGIEVGIQAVQLLMDPRRRDNLKKKMKEQYPLVPDAILDTSIDITAKAFMQVAPEKLKIALQPGGMDRVRPDIEQVIVEFTLGQPFIQNIPMLDNNDKRQLVKLLVSMSLDYVLRDAEVVLSSPEVQLEALEEQIREVKLMMGPRRLLWYRARRNVLEITIAFALSLTGFLAYQQRNVPVVSQTLSIAKASLIKVGRVVSIPVKHSWFVICFLYKKISNFSPMFQKMVLH